MIAGVLVPLMKSSNFEGLTYMLYLALLELLQIQLDKNNDFGNDKYMPLIHLAALVLILLKLLKLQIKKKLKHYKDILLNIKTHTF